MTTDKMNGIKDGFEGLQRGFADNQPEYIRNYETARRIAICAAGVTVKEANIIKLCGGYILRDSQVDRLKREALAVLNGGGELEEHFELAEMGGAIEIL